MNRREFVELGIVGWPLTAALERDRPDTEMEARPTLKKADADADDLEAARRIVANHDVPNGIQPRFFPSLL